MIQTLIVLLVIVAIIAGILFSPAFIRWRRNRLLPGNTWDFKC